MPVRRKQTNSIGSNAEEMALKMAWKIHPIENTPVRGTSTIQFAQSQMIWMSHSSDDDLLVKEEQDEQLLSQPGEDWSDLDWKIRWRFWKIRPSRLRLSEDPVRLYLKEIGQIHLLDADSEFRLAARIEAERRWIRSMEKHAGMTTRATHYHDLFPRNCRRFDHRPGTRLLEDAQRFRTG